MRQEQHIPVPDLDGLRGAEADVIVKAYGDARAQQVRTEVITSVQPVLFMVRRLSTEASREAIDHNSEGGFNHPLPVGLRALAIDLSCAVPDILDHPLQLNVPDLLSKINDPEGVGIAARARVIMQDLTRSVIRLPGEEGEVIEYIPTMVHPDVYLSFSTREGDGTETKASELVLWQGLPQIAGAPVLDGNIAEVTARMGELWEAYADLQTQAGPPPRPIQ